MVNRWPGAVVFVAIASLATLPSGSDGKGDCAGDAVRCGDGSCAGADLVCDGTLDCTGGADEALELCRGSGRPLFALILLCQQPWSTQHDTLCPEVCRELPKYCYYAIGAEHGSPGTCVLPQPSKRGAYTIVDVEPRGRGPADFSLEFSCPRGYRLQGEQPRCVRGSWMSDFPTCVLAMFPVSLPTAKPTVHPIPCVLPEFPDHGFYRVNGILHASPGETMRSANLTVYCLPGYAVGDHSTSYCVEGRWIPEVFPNCIPMFSVSLPTAKPTVHPIPSNSCVLPEFPDHGFYRVNGILHTSPGETMRSANLTVYCPPGYAVVDHSTSYCVKGRWIPEVFPNCIRSCTLPSNPGTTYRCVPDSGSYTVQLRVCSEKVPSGMAAVPHCHPHYHNNGSPRYMRCLNGSWDHIALCELECGLLTPSGEHLIIGGQASVHSQIPWHTLVYAKRSLLNRQICGGSLVSTRVVISAAHCYWSGDTIQPAENFAVAVGKADRSWEDQASLPDQTSVQTSNVREIKVPIYFTGHSTVFGNDIALVILETPVVVDAFVRPVCLNFDLSFETHQYRENVGEILSRASEKDVTRVSHILRVRHLPYVDLGTCIANSLPGFRVYITPDKFCAGSQNGTGLCPGDSGGGLAFPVNERGKQRYYLRGIASVIPYTTLKNYCSINGFMGFTRVLYHEQFIQECLKDVV